MTTMRHFIGECDTCGDNLDALEQECPKSPRRCHHHCNHSWSHDRCCWCDQEWGEDAPTATAAPVTVVLTGDQQEALQALWDLMPYLDALASDWYDLLPVEFRKVVEQ